MSIYQIKNNKNNLFKIIKNNVLNMLKSIDTRNCCPKILILDDTTFVIISNLLSKSELNNEQVFLFENINNRSKKKIDYVKTICILQPTDRNLKKIYDEMINDPRSDEYYIYFTEYLSAEINEKISKITNNRLKKIGELYINFIINQSHSFSCPFKYEDNDIVQTLFNLTLSMKVFPEIFTSKSDKCHNIANLLKKQYNDNLNIINKYKKRTLLLLLDRDNDPITPILTNWKYLSMINEYIGINNNTVIVNTESKENKFVLNFESDDFMINNIFSDYGSLSENLKNSVQKLKQKNDDMIKLKEDKNIKKLILDTEEYKSVNSNMNKHTTIINYIFKTIKNNNLLKISEYEQELMTNENINNNIFNNIMEVIKDEFVDEKYKLKLLLLYLVRFNFDPIKINMILNTVKLNNYNLSECIIKYQLIVKNNLVNLPSNKKNIKSMLLKFVPINNEDNKNFYMRFKPQIQKILEEIKEGNFKNNFTKIMDHNVTFYDNIIIYIVGGYTFEELSFVNEFNNNNYNNYYIGGDKVINYNEFLNNIINRN